MKLAKLTLAVLTAAFLTGCAANDAGMEKSEKQGSCCSEGSTAGKDCCSEGAKTGECTEGAKTEKAAEKN